MDYPGKVITKNQVTPTQTSATGVWTLDDAAAATRNNNWPVAGVPNPISKSLRFNSADSAFLNRTPASASNRRTFTWSGWVKRCLPTTTNTMFASDVDANNFFAIWFREEGDNGRLEVLNYSSGYDMRIETTQVFRDVSAWYHLVVAIDTTQATSTNRVKIYINGSQVTALSTTTYPSQNFDTDVNNTNSHKIGVEGSSYGLHNGYLTEINFIDGQALTPSSFGMTDPITGVWEPLKYSGTYGTNGFYLNFKDATSTTTLGLDYSGNSNTWTTNNFSVTAGAGNDSLTDVPTPWIVYNTTGDVGGVVRGNYATLNPLLVSTASFANGNLDGTIGSGTASAVFAGTVSIPTTGKYYFEYTVNTSSGDVHAVGIVQTSLLTKGTMSTDSNAEYATSVIYRSNGVIYKNTSSQGTYSSISSGDIIGVAVDVAGGTCGLYKNGSLILSVTSITSTDYSPFACKNPTGGSFSASFTFNAGQRPFAYTPPSGFRSLCTTNLPASTVLKGSEYMNAVLYTGNGSSQTITGVGFQPDWVWIKQRSGTANHNLYDVLRIVSGDYKRLYSNLTIAEESSTYLGNTNLSAFTSDGFSLGAGTDTNANTSTYVGWNWKANGAGVSNTAGSITSTVSANTTSGFSVVTYTGNGSSGATIGHGLGVAPSMFIVKSRGTTDSWGVYHASLGNTKGLYLETTGAAVTSSAFWNNTSPTSTVFSVSNNSINNASSTNYVAYCFAPISGFSAFGSYTGNGSADGPFVYLGFRPRFVMVKRTDSSGNNWTILDTSRDTYNAAGLYLYPNLSAAEDDYRASTGPVDILSNGFKQRSALSNVNASGATYIYACFAENPFKNALAR